MESNATPSVPRRADGAGDTTPVERHTTDASADGTTPRVTEPTSGARATTAEPTTGQRAATAAPKQVVLDPSLDSHQRQGFTGGTWIALILGTVILVLLLIFILQNNLATDFAYFGWQFSLPLGVAMLFAAIAGVLITALLGSVRMFRLSRRVRKLEKERAEIKRALR